MVICAFDNPPKIQASWQHRLFTLDMDSLNKKTAAELREESIKKITTCQ
jgi:hypothetical protein